MKAWSFFCTTCGSPNKDLAQTIRPTIVVKMFRLGSVKPNKISPSIKISQSIIYKHNLIYRIVAMGKMEIKMLFMSELLKERLG